MAGGNKSLGGIAEAMVEVSVHRSMEASPKWTACGTLALSTSSPGNGHGAMKIGTSRRRIVEDQGVAAAGLMQGILRTITVSPRHGLLKIKPLR